MEGASAAAPPGVGREGVVGCASTRAPAIGSPVPARTTIPAITPPGGCCSDWVENVWKIIIHPIATTSLMSTPRALSIISATSVGALHKSIGSGRPGGRSLTAGKYLATVLFTNAVFGTFTSANLRVDAHDHRGT